MRTPDFFIVGAPKAGTTSMHAYLRRHPEIFMPALKAPCFFGSDLIYRHGRPVSSREAYVALFAGAEGQTRIGEATDHYWCSTRAAREIKDFRPDARIIILLRDPVQTLHAWHSQNLHDGEEDIGDLAAALAAEPDRRQGRRIPAATNFVQALYYRALVRYADRVEEYFALFGRDRVRVILFDDLAEDTARVYGDTLRFLGVDESFRPAFEVANRSTQLRSLTLERMLRTPPPLLRWVARTITPPAVRSGLRSRLQAANRRVAARAPLPAPLRQALRAELAPEIDRLSRVLGRDLGRWTA